MGEQIPLLPAGEGFRPSAVYKPGRVHFAPRGGRYGQLVKAAQFIAPVVAASAAADGSWFRRFAYSSPPQFSTHVHNSLNMAYRRSLTRTRRTRSRRRFGRGHRRIRRFRRNKFSIRRKVVQRSVASRGSIAIPNNQTTPFLMTQAGGVIKFNFDCNSVNDIFTLVPTATHYRIKTVRIKISQEPHSLPTYDEVLKNVDWTYPACVRVWSTSATLPKDLASCLLVPGVRTWDCGKELYFKFAPKFARTINAANSTYVARPRNCWIPKGEKPASLNGPVLAWDKWTSPLGSKEHAYRFKVLTSYVIETATFSGTGFGDQRKFVTNAHIEALNKPIK